MKKLLTLVLIPVILLSLAGCDAARNPDNTNGNGNRNSNNVNEEQNVGTSDGRPSNYRITAVGADLQGGEGGVTTEIFCAQGWYLAEFSEDMELSYIDYYDNASGMHYWLEPYSKTGVSKKMDRNKAIEEHLILGDSPTNLYDVSGLTPIGNEKICGRNALVYDVTILASEPHTLWIDEEYGILLKDVFMGVICHEVTEFKLGSVTLDNVVNLREYNIMG
jgi:hypothetical protein